MLLCFPDQSKTNGKADAVESHLVYLAYQDVSQLGVFETELEQIERQLKAVEREQHQLFSGP